MNTVYSQECEVGMIKLYNGVNCQTDQSCQRLSTGFFCYNGKCCSNAVSLANGYGSSCTTANQCAFANSQCTGNVCYCQFGYNFNGQTCLPNNGIQRDDNTINGFCQPNEVSVNQICYPLRSYYGNCDYNEQCAFPGGICDQRQCKCNFGQIFNGFQCIQDRAIPVPSTCPANQILINNQCLQRAGLGERCMYDEQCEGTFTDSGYKCQNGICTRVNGWTPQPRPAQCRNPNARVEMSGSTPKNCISQTCSNGFHCEYSPSILQYICCGPIDGESGEIKMYPGYSNLPLQCFGINSCTFVDYPYCVYSQSYRHNVCCSKPDCI
ncbi:unnamed protein product [Bursaphelenchus okinawaensis]|uniref:EB domain-containing protein n=1 Tax=Bursaphelenchus okinawaensis TaxID=465554 RepID=A0A811L925_9BILA|nr:unnamed protein product [Bursaphelenchus okinawaensis]CAG9118795.1 unnamed protein product [Bursaphelenchus okinawaensis]